jgi:uncharacterized protein
MEKLWHHYISKHSPVLTAFIAALIGGGIFTIIRTPVPWLLGPIAAVMLTSKFIKKELYWPTSIRNTGMLIIGYSFGLSLTKEALIEISAKLPAMLILTVALIALCASIAYFISRWTGVDYPTILTGSIPGGLSQMILFAEEAKEIDITTVSFLQVTRLLMIVFIVPFIIVIGPFSEVNNLSSFLRFDSTESAPIFPNGLIYALFCVVMAVIGQKIKVPTPYLLGPIVATTILNLTDLHAPSLPTYVLDFSQVMIGVYIGLMLKPDRLKAKGKMMMLAILSGLVLIFGSMLLGLLLVHYYGVSISTSFLSLAPGGMDQMGILAHETNADVSIVTAFQIFRLLFIFFAVPPFLRWVFRASLIKANEPKKQKSG